MPIIIENFNLSELKAWLTDSNLYEKYSCTPTKEYFFIYTTPGGMDAQNSYRNDEVCAKFWIQYFPKANAFALNVNFFANIDGAPIGSTDFKRLVPQAVLPYEYYNGEKISWIYNEETGVYNKVKPVNCCFNLYPNILTIIPTKTE
jgi:hypothetical protein